MKRLLYLLLAGVLMMTISSCGKLNTATEQRSPDVKHTSVFSWNRELFENAPETVMAKLSDYHIDRVYHGLYPADLESESTAELVSGLKKQGVETVYLTGDPEWNDENIVIEWTLNKLIAYNNGIGKGAEIKAICYDAEFYSNDRADEEHFSAYVSMMEKISKKAHEYSFDVIYCLPYWLPEISEDLFKELIAQADEITIMNYDVGHETDHLSEIFTWCKEAGVRVESIFETQPADGVDITENNTYFAKGKDAVIKAAEELQKQYDGISIAYHHLTSLLEWE